MMTKRMYFELTDADQKEIFCVLVHALNQSGVTWGCEYDCCSNQIIVEIGEGY